MDSSISRFAESPPADSPGFQMRDVVRFFVVDIIVTAALRLLELVGFFQTIDHHVVAILASKVLVFLYLIWLVRERRDAWSETGAATPGKWYAWPLAIGIYVVGYPLVKYIDAANVDLMTQLYAWLGLVYEHRPQIVIVLAFEDILSPPVRVALIATIALAGPILEELAFRGMMLDAFRRRRNAVWSVIATGVLFGAYHFSLPFVLPLSVFGIIFGTVRVLCKSLWCSIFIHSLHNSLTLCLVAYNLGLLREFGEKWFFWL